MHTQNNCQIHSTVFFMHSTGLIHSSIYEHFYINSSACSYRMLSLSLSHTINAMLTFFSIYPSLRFPFDISCSLFLVSVDMFFYRSNKITCILCMDVKLVKHSTWIAQHQSRFSCCLLITRKKCFFVFLFNLFCQKLVMKNHINKFQFTSEKIICIFLYCVCVCMCFCFSHLFFSRCKEKHRNSARGCTSIIRCVYLFCSSNGFSNPLMYSRERQTEREHIEDRHLS